MMKKRRRDKPAPPSKANAPETGQVPKPSLKEELLAIGRRCAALPVYDSRTPEEILGYDENGLPT